MFHELSNLSLTEALLVVSHLKECNNATSMRNYLSTVIPLGYK